MNTPDADEKDAELDRLVGRAMRISATPTLVLDPSLRPIWVSDSFTEQTGFTLERLELRALPLPQHPGVRLSDPTVVAQAVAEGREVSQVVHLRGADRRWAAALFTASPVRSQDRIVIWAVRLDDFTAATSVTEQAHLVLARERRDLQVIAEVSELCAALDEGSDLTPLTRLLEDTVVRSARILLDRERRWRRTDLGTDPAGRLVVGGADGIGDLDLGIDHPKGSLSAIVADRIRVIWRDPGIVALIPIPTRNGVIGLLAVIPLDGVGAVGLDDQTRTVLRLTARRVGTSLENVALYQREHQLAETMQRAMLPQQAEIDGLDVWTYYAPNVGHAQIGGDWYDILPLGEDLAGVVIGDVVGHDVEAAAAMGQLRSVVRAYAFDGSPPATVLTRVDQLVAGMRVPRSAGLVYSTWTRTETGWRLDYTRAGHLPALLRHSHETRFLLDSQGPMIGHGQDAVRLQASVDLVPGDVVVYFTDGLVERRGRSMRDGMDDLARVVGRTHAPDAAGIGEEVLSRLAHPGEDDIAVVVVQIPAPIADGEAAAGPRRRRWTFPGDAGAPRQARRAVERTCHAWQRPTSRSAELVVSELVSNAVTHGWGDVTLRLFDTGDGLRIEVEDANPTPPVTTDGHPNRIGGYGMKIVERLADWGWRHAGSGKVVWAKIRPETDVQKASAGEQ